MDENLRVTSSTKVCSGHFKDEDLSFKTANYEIET